MLTAQQIKDKLALDDIKKLVDLLGGELHSEEIDHIKYDTFCHSGSSKNKLCLYHEIDDNGKENFNFHCYTECGSFNIFELVMKIKDYTFPEALQWITTQLRLDTMQYGFSKPIKRVDDWIFINSLKKHKFRREKEKKEEKLDVYDESILNIFQRWYDKSWIAEGISVESMEKFEVGYSTLNQQIIIPHRGINSELIGIRARNTVDEAIQESGKYVPFRIGNVMYKHPLGKNLFGIHKNQNTIKNFRKVMIVESEKAVLQAESFFPNNNFTLAICGNSFTDFQRDMVTNLGVREVIISLDKEFLVVGDNDYLKWIKHIQDTFVKRLNPYAIVTVLIDEYGLLSYKESPTDRGKENLLKLLDNKVYVN